MTTPNENGHGESAVQNRINILWANRIEEVFDGTMKDAEHALRNFVRGLTREENAGGVEYCETRNGPKYAVVRISMMPA
jgi:hypothetical protein